MVGGSGMCVPHACGTSCSECIVQVPGPAYLCLLHIPVMGYIDLWLYIGGASLCNPASCPFCFKYDQDQGVITPKKSQRALKGTAHLGKAVN